MAFDDWFCHCSCHAYTNHVTYRSPLVVSSPVTGYWQNLNVVSVLPQFQVERLNSVFSLYTQNMDFIIRSLTDTLSSASGPHTHTHSGCLRSNRVTLVSFQTGSPPSLVVNVRLAVHVTSLQFVAKLKMSKK